MKSTIEILTPKFHVVIKKKRATNYDVNSLLRRNGGKGFILLIVINYRIACEIPLIKMI